jgi:hypothetical protein
MVYFIVCTNVLIKINKNMKQLLSLFLFLLPCFAWAQYPSNGNQKITLGEQTTGDGLIYRGVATDTVRKPSVDTMAYMVLDTTTNIVWHYKKATSNAWLRLNLLPSDTASIAYVNTYGTQTVNGAKTFTSAVTATRFNPNHNTATGTGMYLPASSTLGFSTDGLERLRILSDGKVGIGVTSPLTKLTVQDNANLYSMHVSGNDQINGVALGTTSSNVANVQGYTRTFSSTVNLALQGVGGNLGVGEQIPTEKLHVNGNARITAMNGIDDIGANVNGVLQAAISDMNLKNTIENSPFGLNEILLLKPVTFLYNDTDRKIDSDVKEVGFIAQDVFDIIPNSVSSTGTGDLQLDYRAITATLVKAIQEQQALIKALEQRIINLENK